MHAVDAGPQPVDLPGSTQHIEYGPVQGDHHADVDSFGEPTV
jgi:hypothetical protein